MERVYLQRAVWTLAEALLPNLTTKNSQKFLAGIDQLYGENSAGSTYNIKTALLHISINIDKNYPTPSPLTETEIKQLISPSVLPLLKVMMLSDTEGWSLFEPDVREQRMRDAMKAFKRVDELIFKTTHKGAN